MIDEFEEAELRSQDRHERKMDEQRRRHPDPHDPDNIDEDDEDE